MNVSFFNHLCFEIANQTYVNFKAPFRDRTLGSVYGRYEFFELRANLLDLCASSRILLEVAISQTSDYPDDYRKLDPRIVTERRTEER